MSKQKRQPYNDLKFGEWNVICDRCGFEYKNTECELEWDNLFVCRIYCWEPRQPQDYVRAVPDMQAVPIARPDSRPYYIPVEFPIFPDQD